MFPSWEENLVRLLLLWLLLWAKGGGGKLYSNRNRESLMLSRLRSRRSPLVVREGEGEKGAASGLERRTTYSTVDVANFDSGLG